MRSLLLLCPILLGAQPATNNGRLILETIHKGDPAAIHAALGSGADANTRDDLGATALMHAAAYAPLGAMRDLIAAGADVNAVSNAGFTPVMWSLHDPAKLKFLLSKHADVNVRTKDGNTALILARQNGLSDAVPILLRAGAKDEDGMDPVSRPALQTGRDLLLRNLGVGTANAHDLAVGAATNTHNLPCRRNR